MNAGFIGGFQPRGQKEAIERQRTGACGRAPSLFAPFSGRRCVRRSSKAETVLAAAKGALRGLPARMGCLRDYRLEAGERPFPSTISSNKLGAKSLKQNVEFCFTF